MLIVFLIQIPFDFFMLTLRLFMKCFGLFILVKLSSLRWYHNLRSCTHLHIMVLLLLLHVITFKFTYCFLWRRLNKWIDRWNYTRTYNRCFHGHSIKSLILRILPLMLFSCLLQRIICLYRNHFLNINEWRMEVTFSVCTSVLTINLNFIRLQIEEVVLNHLPVKHVWNLFGIFNYFVEKVVVSGFCWCFFILLQINRILLVDWLVYQILWLSRNDHRLELLFLTCSNSKVICWSVQIYIIRNTADRSCSNVHSWLMNRLDILHR